MSSVRPDPTVAARRYRRELTVVDEYVRRETARDPDQVHCRRGCAECCYGTFPLSLADALLVRVAFARLSELRRRRVMERARTVLSALGMDPGIPFNTIEETEADTILERAAYPPPWNREEAEVDG